MRPVEYGTDAIDRYPVEIAPLWEGAFTGAHEWTEFSFETVDKMAPALLSGTSDVKKFCPNYFSMSSAQKINFWVFLVSAVAKYESGFSPVDRVEELELGIDPITHQQVYSEGLLQLSYQDSIRYKYCDEFNWPIDAKLEPKDPRKTILSPNKNLACGIRILNEIVGDHDKIAFSPGHYWSTLEPGNRNSRVVQIKKLTNGLSFCKKL